MPSAAPSIIDELDDALRSGSSEKRVETLRRITDLFLHDADRLNDEQIAVFDHVLVHLIERIEARALAELSTRLAPVDHAPIGTIQTLARNDEISVAGPVLTGSSRLSNDDLVEIARTMGQAHLLAISSRAQVDEIVTDVLVERGDRDVKRTVAMNPGAKFSDEGFAGLVAASQGDELLAEKFALRIDLPIRFLRDLLAKATEAVRARLLSCASPELQTEIRRIVGDISSAVGIELNGSRDFGSAQQFIARLRQRGELNEAALLRFARTGKYEEAVATLAELSATSISIVRPLMQSARDDGLLIVCKATGLSWETALAMIKIRITSGSLSNEKLERSKAEYEKLRKPDADRLLRFWKVRATASGPKP